MGRNLVRARSCPGVTLPTPFIFVIRVYKTYPRRIRMEFRVLVCLVEPLPLVVETLYYLVNFLIIALERS
jgi:hypothetical protein